LISTFFAAAFVENPVASGGFEPHRARLRARAVTHLYDEGNDSGKVPGLDVDDRTMGR
jgi:hypothetical protein